MFKFGKYAIPPSPYSKYREGRMVTSGKQSSKGVVGSKSRIVADASGSFGVNMGGASPNSSASSGGGSIGPQSGTSGYNVDRYNPVFDQLEEGSILEDWIPRDAAGLDLLFERIYLRDPTIGPGIDIIRNLPWSDFVLEGIEDPEVLKIYQECMESLNVQLLMPDITRDFLVLGKQISSLIFDERRGIFSGIVPHDPDFIRITPLPVSGFDPICDFKLSPGFKKFLLSDDPRMMDARKALPTAFLDAAKNQSGFLPLDPVSTIYLARKASTKDNIGTSLLTRTLYFWAIEKALLNAQLSSTRRRSRSFMHIKAGIDNIWEPTPEEMDALAGLVIQVNEDPVGGVIATRTGVDISEPVGGGADFYKWSDELELFAKYKMQCIGISDALLSGDACMVGDTLIPTEKGLFKISELGDPNGDTWQDLNLKVASRYGQETVVKWLNNGVKPTFLVRTEQGNKVQCTANHPLLVFNESTGQTEWKRTDELKVGDTLCISTKPLYSIEKLALNLKDWEKPKGPRGHSKEISKPEVMTPDLAFLLGVIVAEGTVYKNQVRIPNTDPALLDKCEKIIREVFGLESQKYVNFDPETQEREFSKKKSWELIASSNILVDYLLQMGVVNKSLDERPVSYHKEIPWAVLKADVECWKAYLAGHIEGDGSWGVRCAIISFSEKVINQVSAMLNAMGYLPKISDTRVEIQRVESNFLYEQIKHHMVSKKPAVFEGETKARNRFGIPLEYWKNILENRKVSSSNKGMRFFNGKETVTVTGMQVISEEHRMLYDRIAEGRYTEFLEDLKKIALEDYKKLVELIECKYLFTKVESISYAGEAQVFDLSVKEGREPAFVANGLVVHNTYNNAEQARSVFVETLANLRARIVNKFFMQKTFPIIARLHGFVKRSRAELDHRIRTTSVHSATLPNWARMNQVTSNKLTQRKAMQIPVGDLIVPTINWTKQLKPNQDEKALEILERLKQNEYPTTLAQWASAAGYDPRNLEIEAQKDQELRKKISKLQEEAAPAEEGNAGGEDQDTEEFFKELEQENEGGAPEGESGGTEPVQQSVYGKLRDLGKRTVNSMNQMAIWKNGYCGPLGKAEAAKVAARLLREKNPEILNDQRALLGYLQDKLGAEKAKVMAYCLGRIGVARLPVDSKTAHVIASSARDAMNKHTVFSSKSALLDMRRYQAEIEFLVALTKDKSLSKKDINFEPNAVTNEMGSNLYGGSE